MNTIPAEPLTSSPTFTDFELAKRCRQLLLTTAGSVVQYKGWSDEFSRKELIEASEYCSTSKQAEVRPIDLHNLTKKDCEYLGFKLWNEESELYLIPIWMLSFIDPDCTVTSITGKVKRVGIINNDHRMGLLAYGISFKE